VISIKPLSSIEDSKLVSYIEDKYSNEITTVKSDQVMVMHENSDFMAISVFDIDNNRGVIKFQDYTKPCDNYLMRDGMVKATLNAIYVKGFIDVYVLSDNKNLAVNKQIGLEELSDRTILNNYDFEKLLYAKLPDFFDKGCHSKKKENS
jgi:hypothetical protein